MDILNGLIRLRDDLKTWVTNNLNALNAKIDEKTIPIDSELSSTSTNPVQNKAITNAINNIPTFSGSYNDLTDAPNITEDESGNMVIADESGNIIFKTDADGIHTTALSLNGEPAATETYVNEGLATKQPIGDYALKSDIPDATSAIIDVTELPTENINEDAFYRLLSGSLVINQVVQNAYTCHCVEALPDTGLPATNLNQTEGHIYFTVGDGELYGYVDSILSMGLGVPSGWYPAATLLGALGFGYSGVITNIMDDPKDNTFRLLLEYVIYSYKDSWTSHKTIGWAGTGPSSEIFNDPMNIASGEKSHAEGNSTTASGYSSHAEGYSSHAEGDYSHAEGDYSHAEGNHSHAEGHSSHAEGYSSHAEGHGNYLLYDITGKANATTYSLTSTNNLQYLIIGASVRNTVYIDGVPTYSIAKIVSIDKNNLTITLNRTLSEDTALNNTQVLIYHSGMALGDNSHSEGNQTIAAGRSQHTQGEFNVVDPEYDVNNNNKRAKYAHIVGNGTSIDNRSNAHTLDWDGNAWFAGDVYIGGTGQDDSAAVKLAKMSDISSKATYTDLENLKEELSESIVAETDEWKVVDEAGNIIFSVDASGAHTTALTLNGESVEDIVDERVAALVDSAPDTLNTLNELANALGDDPNFATTVATEIGKKVDKVDGKGLSTNDFTDEYKEKLDGLENTTFEESDPTVPAWAKEATKPTYTADEVGLGNVNNTSDLDKPVSTATQDAIDGLRDELSESITSENNEWKIVDSSGNIVFSVDSQGAHTTNLLLNDEEVATKAYVDDKTSNNMAKPDWNENDETKGSYIKNRTHWMEVSLGTPLIENITVTDSFFIPFTQYDESTIQESKQYIFEINGVQYPATYVYDDDRPSKSIIANEFEFIYEYSSSEYGCTLSYNGENPIEEPYNVSIYEAQVIYHKIDKNFLPEDIGGSTPVRGIDYWTDADKAEIKSYVDEAILGGAW